MGDAYERVSTLSEWYKRFPQAKIGGSSGRCKQSG